jgi:hypothetical protein
MRQSTLIEVSSDDATCPTCGNEYKNQHGMRIHHGQTHDEQLGVTTKVCEICGEEYETLTCRADGSKYCSNACKGAAKRVERVTRTCGYCSKPFDVRSTSERTYCCNECRYAAHRQLSGDKTPNWKGGKITLTCEACGDAYDVDPHRTDRTRACSVECKDELAAQVPAEEHWNYRGGRSRRLYGAVVRFLGDEHWRKTRERIRSDSDCALCGIHISDVERAHHAHHIVPVYAGGTNADELLMPLCGVCHNTVERYTQRFTENHLIPDEHDEPIDRPHAHTDPSP